MQKVQSWVISEDSTVKTGVIIGGTRPAEKTMYQDDNGGIHESRQEAMEADRKIALHVALHDTFGRVLIGFPDLGRVVDVMVANEKSIRAIFRNKRLYPRSYSE